MPHRPDYEVLDIKPGADREQVRHAYRTLIQVWHPDRFTGAMRQRAEDETKRINAAYTRLRNGADPGPRAAKPRDDEKPPADNKPHLDPIIETFLADWERSKDEGWIGKDVHESWFNPSIRELIAAERVKPFTDRLHESVCVLKLNNWSLRDGRGQLWFEKNPAPFATGVGPGRLTWERVGDGTHARVCAHYRSRERRIGLFKLPSWVPPSATLLPLVVSFEVRSIKLIAVELA